MGIELLMELNWSKKSQINGSLENKLSKMIFFGNGNEDTNF
jgi:hypothetical protein